MSYKINHLAIVVPNLDEAVAFWQDALGMPLERKESNPGENVNIAFMDAGNSHIELLEPSNTDSGIAKYLDKRGAGMHHVCLEVDDIEAVMARLVSRGVELINDAPKTREDGTRYCFVHPKSAFGVMIELYETA